MGQSRQTAECNGTRGPFHLMTRREKEYPEWVLRLGFCTQTRWWSPDLTADRVTQHLDANKAMLTAIAGASIPRPLLPEFCLGEPLKRPKPVVHYSCPQGWAATLLIRVCAP